MHLTVDLRADTQLAPQPEEGLQRTPAALTGTRSGQQVIVDTATAGTITPTPRRTPVRKTLARAAVGVDGFINQPGDNVRHPEARRVGRLARLGKFLKAPWRQLVRLFSRRSRAAGGVSDPLGGNTFMLFAGAARTGVDAARNNIKTKVLGKQHSMEAVRTVLTSGDAGIRRGTTALSSICNNLKPQTLSPDTLQGTVEQWSQQTGKIAGLAGQVAKAEFNEDLKGSFTQYGTSGNNPYATMTNDCPQLDHAVRNWLEQGMELTDQLLAAQERAGAGQPPLTDAELNVLQRRVDAFIDVKARAGDMDMSDALREIDAIYNARKTVNPGRINAESHADEDSSFVSMGSKGASAASTVENSSTPNHQVPSSMALPRNFNTVPAIHRLDQEIALQNKEIERLGVSPDDAGREDGVWRMEAERDARILSKQEFQAGRDPRPALQARARELAMQFGDGDCRAQAYMDTYEYLDGSLFFSNRSSASSGHPGVEKSVSIGGNIPEEVDTSALYREWTERLDSVEHIVARLRPHNELETARAEKISAVESYMREAVVNLNRGIDPRGALLKHIEALEAFRYSDETTAAGEATILRTLASEYEILLQEQLSPPGSQE